MNAIVPADDYSKYERVLSPTPYLIRSDSVSVVRFGRVLEQSETIRRRALEVQESIILRARDLLAPFEYALRTELVAESNRIENYDWSPGSVRQAITTYRELVDGPIHGFLTALRNDQRVYEALGLYRAHQLADEWARAGERPREYDIRNLHLLVAAGEHFAGRYKKGTNTIGGTNHRTAEPLDVSRSMHEMLEWWRSANNDPILDATLVHAWLTHIHPFDDGNGRIARLLANMTLVQSGYPPLILRSASDKGQYYDALALSDEGDILPLYDLFAQVIRRSVKVMSREEYVREIVEDRLLTSLDSAYSMWQVQVQRLAALLDTKFRDYGWRLQHMGMPDISAFSLLMEANAEGNCWFIKAGDAYERPYWLLWFGYNSPKMLDAIGEQKRRYPSVFFSARSDDPLDVHPFKKVSRAGFPDEILISPISAKNVTIRTSYNIVDLNLDEASDYLVDVLLEGSR